MESLSSCINGFESSKELIVQLQQPCLNDLPMTCFACASTVYNVLQETIGVVENEVKYPGNIAVVKYNPKKIQPAEIISAIEKKTNFKAEIKEGS